MKTAPVGVRVHDAALVETIEVGPGTNVWAFAHVMNGARVGANCNICDHVFVEDGAVVGASVVIKNGVSVWRGVTLQDNVFVGPNVAFTNDLRPRAKIQSEIVATIVEEGASIGANATIVCGVRLGRYCFVGAGAVVTRDVPPHTLVIGSPARASGHVCRCGRRLNIDRGAANCECGVGYIEVAGHLEAVHEG